jgi:hypothetical protein
LDKTLFCTMTTAAGGEVTLKLDDLVDERGQALQDVLDDPQHSQIGPIDHTIAPFLVDEPVCLRFAAVSGD